MQKVQMVLKIGLLNIIIIIIDLFLGEIWSRHFCGWLMPV